MEPGIVKMPQPASRRVLGQKSRALNGFRPVQRVGQQKQNDAVLRGLTLPITLESELYFHGNLALRDANHAKFDLVAVAHVETAIDNAQAAFNDPYQLLARLLMGCTHGGSGPVFGFGQPFR